MDSLTITTGIISLFQISGTVLDSCRHFHHGYGPSSSDAERLIDEITAFRNVLEQSLTLLPDDNTNAAANFSNISSLNETSGVIELCCTELETLEAKLPNYDAQPLRILHVQLLTWPLREAEVKKALHQIEETKKTLSLVLNLDHTYARRRKVKALALTLT